MMNLVLKKSYEVILPFLKLVNDRMKAVGVEFVRANGLVEEVFKNDKGVLNILELNNINKNWLIY